MLEDPLRLFFRDLGLEHLLDKPLPPYRFLIVEGYRLEDLLADLGLWTNADGGHWINVEEPEGNV